MQSILIYTEGGSVGLGHIIRCIHLARALSEHAQVTFATSANEPIGAERLRQAGHFVGYDFTPADAIIVDVEQYPGLDFMRMMRDRYKRVILIGGVSYPSADELAPYVDLTIYQGELFDHPTTEIALNGPDYLIIDPSFTNCYPNRYGHILISMGGRDPNNFTGRVLDAIPQGTAVKIIVGPSFRQAQGDTSDYNGSGIIKAPLTLRPYVNGARLAIVTTGMTAYECLAAGVPCILFNISPDHDRTAAGLQDRGCAYNMGMGFDPVRLRMAMHAAGALWEPMSAAGRALVDGKGAERVAEAIWRMMK